MPRRLPGALNTPAPGQAPGALLSAGGGPAGGGDDCARGGGGVHVSVLRSRGAAIRSAATTLGCEGTDIGHCPYGDVAHPENKPTYINLIFHSTPNISAIRSTSRRPKSPTTCPKNRALGRQCHGQSPMKELDRPSKPECRQYAGLTNRHPAVFMAESEVRLYRSSTSQARSYGWFSPASRYPSRALSE